MLEQKVYSRQELTNYNFNYNIGKLSTLSSPCAQEHATWPDGIVCAGKVGISIRCSSGMCVVNGVNSKTIWTM